LASFLLGTLPIPIAAAEFLKSCGANVLHTENTSINWFGNETVYFTFGDYCNNNNKMKPTKVITLLGEEIVEITIRVIVNFQCKTLLKLTYYEGIILWLCKKKPAMVLSSSCIKTLMYTSKPPT